jgi:ABC-type Fe3+/spermidine/putrescine transport system ATPase subunit
VSIDIECLTKTFGSVVALRDVTLHVVEGEFIAMLGPSGCGKTTLLKSVAGFCVPAAGRIAIGRRDVTHLPPQKREAGMVFQHYELFPHMTIKENVAFGLRERRWKEPAVRQRVEEMLDLVQLPEVIDRYPAQLSGGQQQRVALARALAIAPKVLLMDEPLGALDLKLRESMQVEIRRIQQRLRITTLYVTHDQGEAMTMADRVAVMHGGTIRQLGSPRDIYADPDDRFVAEFVGRMNFLEGTVEDPSTLEGPRGCRVAIPAIARRHVGQPVVLGVRPEDLTVGPWPEGGKAGPSLWPGTVHTRTYVGNLIQVVVQLDAGLPVTVEMSRHADIPPGDGRVGVGCRPERVILWERAGPRILPEQPPAAPRPS